MSPSDPPAEGDAPGEDVGPPLDELTAFEVEVDDNFVDQVGRRIQRRILTGDLLRLAWTGPAVAVLELLRVPFEWLAGGPGPPSPPDQES